MSDSAVELRRVTKKFPTPEGGSVVAVDDVTLDIRHGEFASLLGPSGCGKTTSLRLVAGFEQPTSGEVVIDGQVMGMTPAFQRPVNTVFQSYALFPHMTVQENVAFGLQMKHVPQHTIRTSVAEALSMVRLPGMEKRYPKQLSGGQQQRVALARALVNRPKVLLLDEPLGALDLKLRKEMQLELKTLQREVGITFIYVTHDQEEALTMSDRIAVMNAGRTLQVGLPSVIYENPKSRFVADFIGETNFMEGQVLKVRGHQAEVECSGLIVLAETDQTLVAGTKATVTVRPEKVRLHPARPAEAANCFAARVENVVYLGTDTRYDLCLQRGEALTDLRLRARHQNLALTADPEARYGRGAVVYVTWPSDCARVLVE